MHTAVQSLPCAPGKDRCVGMECTFRGQPGPEAATPHPHQKNIAILGQTRQFDCMATPQPLMMMMSTRPIRFNEAMANKNLSQSSEGCVDLPTTWALSQ